MLTQRMRSKEAEAGIKPPDIKWLAGAIVSGGIHRANRVDGQFAEYTCLHGIVVTEF